MQSSCDFCKIRLYKLNNFKNCKFRWKWFVIWLVIWAPASAVHRSTDVQRPDNPAIQYSAWPWSDSRHRAVVRSSCQPACQPLLSSAPLHKSSVRALPTEAAKTVVNSFVVSRIDYCNSLLAAAPQYQLDRLQAVMNTAARLIYGVGKFDRIQHLISDRLHWLQSTRGCSLCYCVDARPCNDFVVLRRVRNCLCIIIIIIIMPVL